MRLPTFALRATLINRTIAANSIWLLLTRLANQALAVIFSILVARSLGEAGLGRYAFISALVLLSNVVTTFGTDTLLIREIAGTHSARTSSLGAALWLQLGFSGAAIAILLVSASHLPGNNPESILAIKVYALALVPLAFYTVLSAAMRAYERMDLFLLANLVYSLAQTCGALLLTLGKVGLLALVEVILLAQTLAALFAAYECYRWLPDFTIPWRATLKSILAVVRLSWVLALLAGLGILYQRMGVLLLPFLSGDAVTGWFSAAVRISESFKILHYAVLGALFPALAKTIYLQSQSAGEASLPNPSFARTPFRLLSLFTVLACLGITLLSRPLILLLFGPRYEPSAGVLQVLIWSLLPYTYAARISLELVAAGRERWVAIVLGLAVLATAILYILLVRRFGLIGAALAALGGEAIHAGGLYFAGLGVKFASPRAIRIPFLEENTVDRVISGNIPPKPDEPVLTAARLLAYKRRIGAQPRFPPPEAVILCLHRGALEQAARRHRGHKVAGFSGDFYLLNETDGRLALAGNIGVGAPAATVLLEDLAAYGIKQLVSIGTAAALQEGLGSGDLVVCEHALREEGVSRHYLDPAPFASASPEIVRRLGLALERLGCPYQYGTSWTTDAPYRELHRDVLRHQQAGVKTVEMEAASLFAVGQALGIPVGAAFCVADRLAGFQWQPEFDPKKILAGLDNLIEAAIIALEER